MLHCFLFVRIFPFSHDFLQPKKKKSDSEDHDMTDDSLLPLPRKTAGQVLKPISYALKSNNENFDWMFSCRAVKVTSRWISRRDYECYIVILMYRLVCVFVSCTNYRRLTYSHGSFFFLISTSFSKVRGERGMYSRASSPEGNIRRHLRY